MFRRSIKMIDQFSHLLIDSNPTRLQSLLYQIYLQISTKTSLDRLYFLNSHKLTMEKQPILLQDPNVQEKSDSEESGLELISDEEEPQSPRFEKERINTKPQPNHEDTKSERKSLKAETKGSDNIQSPQRKRRSAEKKLSKTSKTESDPQKSKKYCKKKQFTEECQKQQTPKNQRQSNPQTLKSQEKKQKPNLKDQTLGYDMEWTVNNVDSDTQDNKQVKDDEEQSNLNLQTFAILQDDEIDNLTSRNEQNELNVRMIEKEVTLKYEHWVENKHLLVLYLLFRQEIYEHFPKKVNRRIDIHPSNKNKIRIFGSSQEQLKEISAKISELIQKIAIVKLNIRNQEATKLKSSKLLNQRLLKDKMVIFRYGNSGEKSYYLGGKGTQPQLSAVFKDIRNLKFRYFRMFDYKNTRSYNIMLGHFVRQKELLKAFLKWGIKNLELVPFIPSYSHHGPKKDKEKALCFLMTTSGNTETFSPKDIEMSMMPFVKDNFYSIIFIFKKGEKYLPKLSVEGIFFRYVFEKKFSWAYVYIMCLKREFFVKRDEIIKEIEKLTERNVIFGVRYFDNISPERANYMRPDNYKQVPYPEDAPYSSSIVARRVGWDDVEKKQKEKEKNKKEKVKEKEDVNEENREITEKEQREERGWHTFDWKEHLLNIKDDVKSLNEVKK